MRKKKSPENGTPILEVAQFTNAFGPRIFASLTHFLHFLHFQSFLYRERTRKRERHAHYLGGKEGFYQFPALLIMLGACLFARLWLPITFFHQSVFICSEFGRKCCGTKRNVTDVCGCGGKPSNMLPGMGKINEGMH